MNVTERVVVPTRHTDLVPYAIAVEVALFWKYNTQVPYFWKWAHRSCSGSRVSDTREVHRTHARNTGPKGAELSSLAWLNLRAALDLRRRRPTEEVVVSQRLRGEVSIVGPGDPQLWPRLVSVPRSLVGPWTARLFLHSVEHRPEPSMPAPGGVGR